MDLYYADGNRKIGPIGKAELQALIKTKKVNAKTLIWQQGMTDWVELSNFVRSRSSAGVNVKPSKPHERQSVCSECGNRFAEDEMIRFMDSWVCANCKPIFVQKIKEGVSVAAAMEYAGFWLRFGALFIDGIIMWFISMLIFMPMGFITAAFTDQTAVMVITPLITTLFQLAIPAAYDIWFVGKYAATPGKMACKIKIVTADGGRVSYARACGRHFAKWLSWMILLIGYIMAAFDDQKRTLHDRICETRVIRN